MVQKEEEHKYSYMLNGKLYFVILRDNEVEKFSRLYEVVLTRTT